MPPSYKSVRKINRGYQITLPRFFREVFDVREGDYVQFYTKGKNFYIRPVRIIPKKRISSSSKK